MASNGHISKGPQLESINHCRSYESLRVAIGSRLTESQSLKNMLTDLEELDEIRRMAAQHIKQFNVEEKSSSTRGIE